MVSFGLELQLQTLIISSNKNSKRSEKCQTVSPAYIPLILLGNEEDKNKKWLDHKERETIQKNMN
jgi:hypothetical protein